MGMYPPTHFPPSSVSAHDKSIIVLTTMFPSSDSIVVRGSHMAGNQSGSRCISLKMLSTNQIAGFAHLHKQNGCQKAFCITNEARDRKWKKFLKKPEVSFFNWKKLSFTSGTCARWIRAPIFLQFREGFSVDHVYILEHVRCVSVRIGFEGGRVYDSFVED